MNKLLHFFHGNLLVPVDIKQVEQLLHLLLWLARSLEGVGNHELDEVNLAILVPVEHSEAVRGD